MIDFQITKPDQARAGRLVLAGLVEDADLANAVFDEIGRAENPQARLVALAMCVADLTAALVQSTLGREQGERWLLDQIARAVA